MKIPWRGASVVASWFLWPTAYFIGYWFISLYLATGRRCSIEGCDPPGGWGGLMFFAGMISVPALLTYRWIRWRQHRPAA